jgi:4-hydroxy-tetrahydrodipicolinate synthase
MVLKPEGVFIPNVTPFDKEGEIKYDSLDDLVEYWINGGVTGIVVNDSTGEFPYLSRDEKKKLIHYIKERVSDRAKVFAGTGSMSTWETIELTKDAKDVGAEGALITTPFFFKPNDFEIIRYFVDVIEAVDLPVIIYNVPRFTGYSIAPNVVSRISEECDGLVALKDRSGNPSNIAEVIRLCGNRVHCLSGSVDMFLPSMMLGGKGAIVDVGNILPFECVELFKACRKGDITSARMYQQTASLLNNVLLGFPQIAAIKSALNFLGYNVGAPRKPLLELSEVNKASIITALRNR